MSGGKNGERGGGKTTVFSHLGTYLTQNLVPSIFSQEDFKSCWICMLPVKWKLIPIGRQSKVG
jgi:hypothetical protein